MITKKSILAAHKDEAEAHWKVMQLDTQIIALQAKRTQAHAEWMKCKDGVRFLREEPIEAFPDLPDSVITV